MRKLNKLAVAITVAVGVSTTSVVNAKIELKTNGMGDALLFPLYHGYFENYFTVSNMANEWLQAHLRFRGGAWSAEMRDFDIILSPGDVMVIRIADIDGDGEWEIDQTLDPLNFKYTGVWASQSMKYTCGYAPGCMEKDDGLVPKPRDPFLSAGTIEYQKQAGYFEVIGEAVLDGMNHNIMNALIDPATPSNNPFIQFRTKAFNRLGTTAWIWSDADGSRSGIPWGDDQGLSDVPNVLSGTAFITIPGWSHGLAYNAEALVNFRTATCGGDANTPGDTDITGAIDGCAIYARGEHRIDNYRIGTNDTVTSYENSATGQLYGRRSSVSTSHPHPKEVIPGFSPLAENRAVIVHNENALIDNAGGNSPLGDYVYWWDSRENRGEEAAIAFNNTWGPTLADGDDYEMTDAFSVISSDELEARRKGSVNVNGDPWSLRWTDCFPLSYNNHGITHPQDDYDCAWAPSGYAFPVANSIAEVEEAIRAGGQIFTSYYMDNDYFDKSRAGLGRVGGGIGNEVGLTSQFVYFFPTKFFYFEFPNPSSPTGGFDNVNEYIENRANVMMAHPKQINIQVWDLEERPLGISVANECISPATLEECFTATKGLSFPFEVGFVGIDTVKDIVGPGLSGWQSGRIVFELLHDGIDSPYTVRAAGSRGFAGLMYTFEWDQFPPTSVMSHWRSMHR